MGLLVYYLRFSSLFSYERKFNKLVVQYFYKNLRATDNPKFNELKNFKSLKPMVSGDMPKQNCPWSQTWGRTQCYGLS
jgi:hypothetical protein